MYVVPNCCKEMTIEQNYNVPRKSHATLALLVQFFTHGMCEQLDTLAALCASCVALADSRHSFSMDLV
jgi:hypothetical protein